MEDREDNDLIVPLSFNNQFAHFIFRNKAVDKVAYNPVVACFLVGTLVLLALAVYLFVGVASTDGVEVLYYDPKGSSACQPNSVCTVSFALPSTLKPPVFLLYKLDNFYQNHRRYIQSKSNEQLLGQPITASQASICSPFVTNAQMKVSKSWGGVALDPNAIASPCGAIAYTFFNDSFALSSAGGISFGIDEGGISWPGDVYGKYRRAENSSATQWTDPENEHFVNWMRIAGLPNFKKLWGRISSPLAAGNYSMTISNSFNLTEWSGRKSFLLATDSSAGGKNYLLPVTLLLACLASLLAAAHLKRVSALYRRALAH